MRGGVALVSARTYRSYTYTRTLPLPTPTPPTHPQDVFGEAIFYGAQLTARARGGHSAGAGKGHAKDEPAEGQHPKDEARARAIAAAERARAYAREYFA